MLVEVAAAPQALLALEGRVAEETDLHQEMVQMELLTWVAVVAAQVQQPQHRLPAVQAVQA